uniref:Uncharacterized protein n=1 Tax=viral metagenome TaxID=1070528 RepID=A0A6M3J2D4_9ZZZZ
MKKYLIIATLICFFALPAYAFNPLVVCGGGVAAGCAASLFEDDFDRGDTGDVQTGGSWTSETDTGALLAIVSNAMVFTLTAQTAANVGKNLGSAYTETWTQFTWAASAVDMGGNNTIQYVLYLNDNGNSSSIRVRLVTDASGDLTKVGVFYFNDSAVQTQIGADYAFNPVATTVYTFKLRTKQSTDVDTSDGIVTLEIDDTPVITASDLDYFTYADIQYAQIGNIYTTWTDTAGNTETFNNFEIREDDCF